MDEDVPDAAEAPESPDVPELSPPVVEDEPVAAQAHTTYVGRVPGFVVVATVGSGHDALKALRDHAVDLVLLDFKLPDGDGCVFVPQLAAATRRRRTPVVAVSAHALAADQQRALDVGCRGFIEKPIDVATFVDRVEALAVQGA